MVPNDEEQMYICTIAQVFFAVSTVLSPRSSDGNPKKKKNSSRAMCRHATVYGVESLYEYIGIQLSSGLAV